jgi:hypothetical protein
MLNCHCSMCRKHHGAAFATFVTAPLDQFKWISGEANVGTYQSSENGSRAFCKVCGSVAPAAAPEHGIVFVPAGNLEGELGSTPEAHIFAASKAPWHSITDQVPQFAEYPPPFSGTPVLQPQLEAQTPGVVRGSCLCGDVAFGCGAPQRVFCHCSRCRRGRRGARHKCSIRSMRSAGCTANRRLPIQVPDAQHFAVAFTGAAAIHRPNASWSWCRPARSTTTRHALDGAHLRRIKSSWYPITDAAPRYGAYPPSRELRGRLFLRRLSIACQRSRCARSAASPDGPVPVRQQQRRRIADARG